VGKTAASTERRAARNGTTANDILAAMAYNRETFKDRAEEKLGGALLEHYKATLARLNRQTRWVEHWESEARRLIDTELAVVLLHSIKEFRDRSKAVAEVIRHVKDIDREYRRAAERTVQRNYGLKKLRYPIADEDTQAFYAMVQQVVDTNTQA